MTNTELSEDYMDKSLSRGGLFENWQTRERFGISQQEKMTEKCPVQA